MRNLLASGVVAHEFWDEIGASYVHCYRKLYSILTTSFWYVFCNNGHYCHVTLFLFSEKKIKRYALDLDRTATLLKLWRPAPFHWQENAVRLTISIKLFHAERSLRATWIFGDARMVLGLLFFFIYTSENGPTYMNSFSSFNSFFFILIYFLKPNSYNFCHLNITHHCWSKALRSLHRHV